MCGGGAAPVETIKTPMGDTGTATPAQPRRRAQSLLSRAVVDSSGQSSQVVGQKQTLGA